MITASPTVRYVFRCLNKHVWTKDYDRAKLVSQGVAEGEKPVYPWNYSERTCPTCGDMAFLPQPIKATASDTPCGSSCQEARGLICQCSCYGASHGAKLLRKEIEKGQEFLAARFILPRPGLDTKSQEWGHLR